MVDNDLDQTVPGFFVQRAVLLPEQLKDRDGHHANNYDSDKINVKAARAASLHQRRGMTLRKIAITLNSISHGKSSITIPGKIHAWEKPHIDVDQSLDSAVRRRGT